MRVDVAILQLCITGWCAASGHPLMALLWLACRFPAAYGGRGAMRRAIAIAILVAAVLQAIVAAVITPLWYSGQVDRVPGWAYMLLMPDVNMNVALAGSVVPPVFITIMMALRWDRIVKPESQCVMLPTVVSLTAPFLQWTSIIAAALYPTMYGVPFVAMAMTSVAVRSFTNSLTPSRIVALLLVVSTGVIMTISFAFQNRYIRDQLFSHIPVWLHTPWLYDLDFWPAVFFVTHLGCGGLAAVVASWVREMQLQSDVQPSDTDDVMSHLASERHSTRAATRPVTRPSAAHSSVGRRIMQRSVAALNTAGRTLRHYLLIVPLLSIMVMVCAIVAFDSVITLAAVPMVLLALLTTKRTYLFWGGFIHPLLCAGIVMQYVVLALRNHLNPNWLTTFFTTTQLWSRVVEVVAAMAALLILAVSRHAGCDYMDKKDRGEVVPPVPGTRNDYDQDISIATDTSPNPSMRSFDAIVLRGLTRHAARRWPARLFREARILIREFSYLLSLLFVFFASTCLSTLDAPHALMLGAFAACVTLPRSIVRKYLWPALTIFVAFFASYAVTWRFIMCYDITLPDHAFTGIRSETLGARDYPPWELIPYWLAVFATAVEWRSHWHRSSHDVVADKVRLAIEDKILASWLKLGESKHVQVWKHRVSLVAAGAVFFGLVVYEPRSLFVILFLNVFLVNCMLSAYRAPAFVLQLSWRFASLLSYGVAVAVSAYQFNDITRRMDDFRCGTQWDSDSKHRLCLEQIGFTTTDTALFFHLVPWVVASLVCQMHVGRGRKVEDSDDETPEQELESMPHAGPQQKLLKFMEHMASVASCGAATATHCGGTIAMIMFLVALASQANLATFIYAFFLFAGIVGKGPMAYAWLHIMAQYMYQFWFVPDTWDTTTDDGVKLLELVGLNRTSSSTPDASVLVLLFVFLANLLYDSTKTLQPSSDVARRFSQRLMQLQRDLTLGFGYELTLWLMLGLYSSVADTAEGIVIGLFLLLVANLWSSSKLLRSKRRLAIALIVASVYLLGSYIVIILRHNNALKGSIQDSDAWNAYYGLNKRPTVLVVSGLCVIVIQALLGIREITVSHFADVALLHDGHRDFHEWFAAKAPPTLGELLALSEVELHVVAPPFVLSPADEDDWLLRLQFRCLQAATSVVKFIPPAAVVAVVFACRVTSALSLYELIVSALWLAFADFVNCGGHKKWRLVITALAVPWLLIPPIVNIPTLTASNNDGNLDDNILSSLGLTMADGVTPLTIDAWGIAIIVLVLVHRRLTEHFYAATLVRELHKDELNNTTKHIELMANLQRREDAEWAKAQDQLLRAETELQRVRESGMGSSDRLSSPTGSPTHAEDESVPQVVSHPAGTDESKALETATVTAESLPPPLGDDATTTAAAAEDVARDAGAGEGAVTSTEAGDKVEDERPLKERIAVMLRTARDKMVASLRSDVLAAIDMSYRPENTKQRIEGKPLWAQLIIVNSERGKTLLLEVVVFAVFMNFAQSITVFDLLPMIAVAVFGITVYPWPPLRFYVMLMWYTVIGLFLKTITYVAACRAQLKDGALRTFVTTVFIYIPPAVDTEYGEAARPQAVNTAPTASSDLGLDCLVLITCILLIRIAVSSGVYQRADASIFRIKSKADENGQGDSVRYSTSSNHEGSEDAGDDARASAVRAPVDEPESVALLDASESVQGGHENRNRSGRVTVTRSASTATAAKEDDAKPPAFVARVKELVQHFYTRYWGRKKGTGHDTYLMGVTLLLCIILVITFGYFSLTRDGRGSFIDSIKADLLPGPMVLVLIMVGVVMVFDRGVYVLNSLEAKIVLHIVVTAGSAITIVYWHANVQVSNAATFFLLMSVSGYWCISAYQIKLGFPVMRRSDPFTPYPESTVRYIGYSIFRAIPFLSELRTLVDWTFSPTTLPFDNWLKVNDIKRAIFERQVAIVDQKETKGARRTLGDKLGNGGVRLLVLMILLFFPLAYYSTFNPNLVPNSVTQLSVDLSLTPGSPTFTQAQNVPSESMNNNLATWMQNMFPALAEYNIASSTRTTQLVQMDSCSGEIWVLSPQSERNLILLLQRVVNGTTTLNIELDVTVTRKASTSAGGLSQTLHHSWPVDNATANMLLATVEAPAELDTYVSLGNFYCPVILNQPSSVNFYDEAMGTPGAVQRNCSLKLRTEPDRVLNGTFVRYWCLMCDAPFSSGFVPPSLPSSFPGAAQERSCLTTGTHCPPPVHPYKPTKMYFVTVSEQVPLPDGFIPNVGIIALYTTFVLAVGRVLRGTFTAGQQIILSEVADPKPLAWLVRYLGMARHYHDFVLEQRIYLALIDLIRNPSALLERTGRQRDLFDPETGTFFAKEDHQQH